MITLKIALLNVIRHRTRSLITLSAIAFGCVAMIFVGGYFEDILLKMRESYIRAHTGHLQIYREGYSDRGSAAPFDYLISDPGPIIAAVSRIKGVQEVARRIQFAGLISTGATSTSCFVQGIEPEKEHSLKLGQEYNARVEATSPLRGSMVIADGEPLAPTDDAGVILGGGLAKSVGAKVGDGLVLLTNTERGSVNALDVVVRGVFRTSSKEFDDHAVRMSMMTAQRLLQTAAVQSLVVILDDTEQTDTVKLEMIELFERMRLPLEIRSWEELSDFYAKTKAMFNMFYSVIMSIVAIIVVLSIFNTMNMAVLERTSEIGTILALGTRRSGVVTLFLFEGLALGVIGGTAGIATGSAVLAIVSKVGIVMPPPPGATMKWLSQPLLVPSVLISAFCLSVLSSVISSLYPAYRASRLEIAQALRHFS